MATEKQSGKNNNVARKKNKAVAKKKWSANDKIKRRQESEDNKAATKNLVRWHISLAELKLKVLYSLNEPSPFKILCIPAAPGTGLIFIGAALIPVTGMERGRTKWEHFLAFGRFCNVM